MGMTSEPVPGAGSAPAQRVTILLCTYNGARHLEAQLASYLAQDHAAWDLWVSDDGSSDATLALLEAFRAQNSEGRVIRILRGPGRGAVANFLSLLCHPDLPGQPVALSDQDDVWMPHKLGRAMAALARSGPFTLYGAQSLHTDADLRVVGRSHGRGWVADFGNALVQNIVSGHSAALGAGALARLRQAGPLAVPHHDWWLYLLTSGAGGPVVIDPEPVLFYRQHAGNVVGAHQGWRAKFWRLRMITGRGYGAWIAANAAALAGQPSLLSPENRARLEAFGRLPRFGPGRLCGFIRLGIRRQGRFGTALLWAAALLGRV